MPNLIISTSQIPYLVYDYVQSYYNLSYKTYIYIYLHMTYNLYKIISNITYKLWLSNIIDITYMFNL